MAGGRARGDWKARWRRFWFFDGGRLGASVLRMAIAVSVYLTLRKIGIDDYEADLQRRSAALYQPDGILMLLGGDMPSASFLQATRAVAYVSTALLFIGLATRLSNAISLLSTLALASFAVSFSAGWPHQYNVVFLVQIAFLGARGGDVLSADWLIHRLRSRPRPAPVLGYQWSLRLSALAAASMYFDAFLHKLVMGGPLLRWAFSDNLRHQLLVRFDWTGIERTPLAHWLMQEPWRYQGAALFNLVAQCSPLIAFFLFRRPLWRFLLGMFFVAETVGLALVMDLWNLHWLPLAAVFVDWDALVGWVRQRAGAGTARAGTESPVDPDDDRRSARIVRGFVAGYVAITLVIGLVPRLDYTLRTYPFSRFPMFGMVRAREPYGVRDEYAFYGNRIELLGVSESAKVRAWLDRAYHYRWLQRIHDPELLERKVAALFRRVRSRFKLRDRLEGVRVHLALFIARPHPAPPTLDVHRVGIIAESDGEDFRSLRGSFEDPRTLALDPVGFEGDVDIAGLWALEDDRMKLEELGFERNGNRLTIPPRQRPVLVLADVVVGDETLRYVVARDPPVDW